MSRGFQVVSAYSNQEIALPRRKTQGSAGYDLAAAETVSIAPGAQAFCPTGVKAYMPENEVLFVFPRSSLFQKKQLLMTNSVGIIDADYYDNTDNEGHILISFVNLGKETAVIAKGERIAQGVFTTFGIADGDGEDKEKRNGGFGSTD